MTETSAARYRYSAAVEPEPTPEPTKVKKLNPRGVPLRLNRNFMNYPLARDARQRSQWQRAKAYWWLALPGKDRVQMRLPADTAKELRRCPTGFDMNVLYLLLAEVQHTELARLEFPSLAAMLRALGLSAHTKSRDSLVVALELWEKLSVLFLRWHERGEHHQRIFPPPIKQLELAGQRIVVTLSGEWVQLALAKSYYAPVPVPLPFVARTQNLALLLLTSALRDIITDQDTGEVLAERLHSRTLIGLSYTVGLTHRQHNLDLKRTFLALDVWLIERGGRVVSGEEGTQENTGRHQAAAHPA